MTIVSPKLNSPRANGAMYTSPEPELWVNAHAGLHSEGVPYLNAPYNTAHLQSANQHHMNSQGRGPWASIPHTFSVKD